MRQNLTLKRLLAIAEALSMRLAGPIEPNGIDRTDYDRALDWVRAEIAKRKRRKP